jgi:hypothetical protein
MPARGKGLYSKGKCKVAEQCQKDSDGRAKRLPILDATKYIPEDRKGAEPVSKWF